MSNSSYETHGVFIRRMYDTLLEWDIPSYMREPIFDYILNGQPPGGFLRAIFENNLHKAGLLADGFNRNRLLGYSALLDVIPLNSWGSSAKVNTWIELGGLNRKPGGMDSKEQIMGNKSVVEEERWTTKAGLEAVITWSVPRGYRCGYVQIPKDHPLYEICYDTESVTKMNVHGGVTYSGRGDNFGENPDDRKWFLGFDCAHAGDTTRLFSDGVLRSHYYVFNECERLAKQIKQIQKKQAEQEEENDA